MIAHSTHNTPGSFSAGAACQPGTPSKGHPTSRRQILGVEVNALEPIEAFHLITDMVEANESGRAAFMPVHSLITAVREPAFARAIDDFTLVLPDGQPVRWLLNLRYKTGLIKRVYGPAMMWRLCEWAAAERVPIYLFGGRPEVLPKLEQALRDAFDTIEIAGSESPPFGPLSDQQVDEAAARITASGARMVFIGLGCPKQELIADRLKNKLAGVQLCVGAAFDFHAGAVSMAPRWMQRRGLEWLYRLVKEPRRLWRRYLVTNTLFLLLCCKEVVLPRRRPTTAS